MEAILRKSIELEKKDYCETHLGIINNFLPTKMSDMEIRILALFMSLDRPLIEDDMFNTLARKKVKEKLNNMSASSLSNHIKSLIKKGFILKHEVTNKLTLVSYIVPSDPLQFYQFRLKLKDND